MTKVFYTKFVYVILYTVNIWCAFDMNENIVTQKFLTKILRTKLMRITVSLKAYKYRLYHELEYSCNKCSNLIGQLEVHYFTYRPPERSYK